MKKTIKLFSILAILLGAVSCQDNELDNGLVIDDGNLTITATIVKSEATRVTYDDTTTPNTITPAWTIGDKIIGFDDADQKFTFTVSSVDGAGRASLDLGSYSPGAATKLYAIYYPGKAESDISVLGEDKLVVDLSTQNGAELNESSPVLMCATAEITGSSVTLAFENQTAIIGVTKFKLPAAATITSVSVDGLITSGKFKLDGGGNLVLTPSTTPSTITATGTWATGEGNICDTPLYFATLPTSGANIVLNAGDNSGNDYANLSAIASANIEAGNYYYMAKNLGAPVADVNGVKYGTIEEAFAAANRSTSAVKITLLSDCWSNAALKINTTKSGTGVVTLDLDTYTLTGLASDTTIVVAGRTMTITGSGSGKITSSVNKNTVRVEGSEATLNITGGTIESTASRGVHCLSKATLNILGGTITSSNSYGVYCEATVSVSGGTINTDATGTSSAPLAAMSVANGGTGTISGGKLTCHQSYTSCFRCYGPSSSVTMSGGICEGRWGCFQNGGANTVDITGGTIETTSYALYLNNASSVANISGGIITNTSTAATIYVQKGTVYVTDGYVSAGGVNPVGNSEGVAYVTGGYFNKPVNNKFTAAAPVLPAESVRYVNVFNENLATKDDYPFTVVSTAVTPKVATVEEGTYTWEFGTIESAINAASIRANKSGDATITLNADCSATSSMTVNTGNDNTITLDLNNYCISSSQSPALTTVSNFVLKDSGIKGELSTNGAIALNVSAGTASISTGSVYGASTAANVSGGSLRIYDAHIYGGGIADISVTTGSITISGGYFNHQPEVGWLSDGYNDVDVEEHFNNRIYNYEVQATATVATVDGVAYGSWGAAAAAACSYGGASSKIVLQLQEDITTNVAVNLTHASKPIEVDLNGHTLSATVPQFITTTETVTITDSQTTKGKLTSNQYQMIYLTTAGTINIDNCVIECTAAAAASSSNAAENSMISLVGTSTSMRGTLNITGSGTKIYTTDKVQLIRAQGNLTITNGEFTSGNDTSKGFYIVYCHNYSNIIINGGSFKSYSSATVYSGNSGGKVTINDGYFFNKDGNYDVSAYSETCGASFTLNGGYYRGGAGRLTNYIKNGGTVNGTFTQLDPAVTHIHGSETLSYSYQIVP